VFFLVRRLFASTGDDEDRRVGTGITGPEARDTDRSPGDYGLGTSGRRADAGGGASTTRPGTRSSGTTSVGGTRESGAGAADTLKGAHREADETSSLLSAASKSERDRESAASYLSSRADDTEKRENLLAAGKKGSESSDRAAALASFRQGGQSSMEDATTRLSAYKRSGGGAGGARSRAAALGFSGDAFRRRKASGELPIEMRVDFQRPTPARNLGWFKEGEERSIGGPGSGADFIISTIPVEGIIAKVRRTGDSFVFEPQDRTFFPEYHLHEGENVLGKRIKVRSPETERITNFSLREWAPTKDRLNRYLHKVDEPGVPKDDIDPGEV
jgi:hypothetical protein